jgi:hypothetical protein
MLWASRQKSHLKEGVPEFQASPGAMLPPGNGRATPREARIGPRDPRHLPHQTIGRGPRESDHRGGDFSPRILRPSVTDPRGPGRGGPIARRWPGRTPTPRPSAPWSPPCGRPGLVPGEASRRGPASPGGDPRRRRGPRPGRSGRPVDVRPRGAESREAFQLLHAGICRLMSRDRRKPPQDAASASDNGHSIRAAGRGQVAGD